MTVNNKWAPGSLERHFGTICSLAPDGSAHLFFFRSFDRRFYITYQIIKEIARYGHLKVGPDTLVWTLLKNGVFTFCKSNTSVTFEGYWISCPIFLESHIDCDCHHVPLSSPSVKNSGLCLKVAWLSSQIKRGVPDRGLGPVWRKYFSGRFNPHVFDTPIFFPKAAFTNVGEQRCAFPSSSRQWDLPRILFANSNVLKYSLNDRNANDLQKRLK